MTNKLKIFYKMQKYISMLILANIIIIYCMSNIFSINAIANIDVNSNIDANVGDENIIYKLQPKYLTTDFNFDMVAATVTYDRNKFCNTGNFRTSADLCGMSWESVDKLSHASVKYPTRPDFTELKLEYNYKISGYLAEMDSKSAPSLTIETNDGKVYYVRLWNYVVDRPLEDWEAKGTFPENRRPGIGNGKEGAIKIDFDKLYSGWSPMQLSGDAWVNNPEWSKVPVNSIKKIMWSFISPEYNTTNSKKFNESMAYKMEFDNWNVSGNKIITKEAPLLPTQKIRICDDYDDVYNLTPERIVSEYGKLGYAGIVNFYIGASRYYDKKFVNNLAVMKTDYPFNKAFEEWYKNYSGRLGEKNIQLIHSISMENVDAHSDFWQRTWDGKAAETFWSPSPHLLSFTNKDVRDFYKLLVVALADLSVNSKLKPIIQLGEPWWWYLEGDEQKPPCFYDQGTKDLFMKEMGYPMHIFKSGNDSVDDYEDVMDWLKNKNGEFSLMLRDTLKSKYPNSEFTVLFFPPMVIDAARVPKMMQIVNFPKEQWIYPNLDFIMLEDYDYLIENNKEKHFEALNFLQKSLNYPPDKIHYLAGFVAKKEEQNLWNNIDEAIEDGLNQGFKEVYVWAFAQIKRDGWVPLEVSGDTKPSFSNTSIKFKLGDYYAIVNGVRKPLDAPAFIAEDTGRTLVPLRFIAEAFNADVLWIEKYSRINISVKGDIEPVQSDTYPRQWTLEVGRASAENEYNTKFKRQVNILSENLLPYDELPFGGMPIDQAPVLVNNRVMVPIRLLAEEIMHLKIEWNEENKTITVTN